MKRLAPTLVFGLALAFVSASPSPASKQEGQPHVFTCDTDLECELEWEEVYG